MDQCKQRAMAQKVYLMLPHKGQHQTITILIEVNIQAKAP